MSLPPTALADGLPEAIRRLVDSVSALPEVRRIFLFGSRARGDAGERSDVDLAVDAPAASRRDWLRIVESVESAETLLRIDVVRLDEAPAGLRGRILSEGKLLYGG